MLDLSVEKQNEQVTTKRSDTPILRRELTLKWIRAVGTPHHAWFEGCVVNSGKVPIDGLIIKIITFAEDGSRISEDRIFFTPDPIPTGEMGTFMYDYTTTGKHFDRYRYFFVLKGGGSFKKLEGSGEEEPVYYCELLKSNGR